MKKIVIAVLIVILVCVSSVYAENIDIVATHETIKEQREIIANQVHETHESIHANLTVGQEAVKDVRQAIKTDVQEVRDNIKQNLTTVKEARETLHENLTAGHEAIQEQHEALMTNIHVSRVNLARNITELRDMIKAEREAIHTEVSNLTDEQKIRIEPINNVRVAVHSLMEMRNLTGDIGPKISDIAEDLNKSAFAIQPFEERIQDRNSLIRFLSGGDVVAADAIRDQVTFNNEKIQNLTQLMQSTTLDPDVQQAMQEQIDSIKQEQDRLNNLEQKERNDKGLFGWLWR